ncbi:hypothetical protein FNJ47_44530 [Bradyrhizobium sp. UFLA 03-164]|uniref:Uncharacterized protein n=1 Tax=Bradyrhizobium uaiense TaxID=2594946 RepID=A0A6P1BVL3_9BRAD|nr:hypothetical protein [Bradyrhizobium uaiense]
MGNSLETLPEDIEAVHSVLLTTRAELASVRAQQSDDQAMIVHLKVGCPPRHGPFGPARL